jgi:hypothetical protein
MALVHTSVELEGHNLGRAFIGRSSVLMEGWIQVLWVVQLRLGLY